MKTMWWIFVSSIVLLILTGYQILWMFLHGLCHLLEKKVGKSYTSVLSFLFLPDWCWEDFIFFFRYIYQWEVNCMGFMKKSICVCLYQVEELVKLLNWFGGGFGMWKCHFWDRIDWNTTCSKGFACLLHLFRSR